MNDIDKEPFEYYLEYWSGDSRDGQLVSGEGAHYFKISSEGLITEAYEWYENDDGEEVVSLVPEMMKRNWYSDLGYEDKEILEQVDLKKFNEIKNMLRK